MFSASEVVDRFSASYHNGNAQVSFAQLFS